MKLKKEEKKTSGKSQNKITFTKPSLKYRADSSACVRQEAVIGRYSFFFQMFFKIGVLKNSIFFHRKTPFHKVSFS